MAKLGVLISGAGTNLQAVIDACQSGELDAELVLVISSVDNAYGLERAKQANIASYCLTDQAVILQKLQQAELDLLVLAGYLKKVSADLVAAYPNRIINIHPSLIPAFSGQGFYGMRIHQAAIERGVKISGATTHFVNEDFDQGPIIDQVAVPVLEGDRPEDLQARVLKEEHRLLVKSIQTVLKEM